MLKRILVGLGDVESSVSAVKQSIELCQSHTAQLTAMTVIDHLSLDNVGPIPIGAGGAAQELRDYRMQLTREIIEETVSQCETHCNEAGIFFSLKMEEGQPLDEICSAARFHDLMVFGHHEKLFEHGVVDEPSDELVRLVSEGVRPILAVPTEPRPVHRVMIALSESIGSARAMKNFVQMRLWDNMILRVVSFSNKPGVVEADVNEAAAFCRAHGYETETQIVSGNPKHELLAYAAENDMDLIVMGNSARNLLIKKIFGETTLNVLRHADRAIFLSQ